MTPPPPDTDSCAVVAVDLLDGLAQMEPALYEADNVPLGRPEGADADGHEGLYRAARITVRRGATGRALAVPRTKFDRNSAAAKAWVADIEAEQERVLAKAGPGA